MVSAQMPISFWDGSVPRISRNRKRTAMTQRTETSGLAPAEMPLEEQRGGKRRMAFRVNRVRACRTWLTAVTKKALAVLTRRWPVGMGDGKGAGRDLRLDFIRGACLIWMFIDHIRGNFLAALTLQRFSFIDVAEIFIFISGYVSGFVYTGAYRRSGFWGCFKKAARRCLQLYAAQVVVFLGSGIVLHQFAIRGTYLFSRDAHLYSFRAHSFETIAAAMALVHAPGLTGLLPLYIMLIGLTPIAIYVLLRRPLWGILCALLLYLATQLVPSMNLYVLYPDRRPWVFNPAAWQLVFIAGLLLGSRRAQGLWWPAFSRRWLVVLSVIGLIAIAIVKCGTSPTLAHLLHSDLLQNVLRGIPDEFPLTGKANVQPLRLVNLFMLVIVASTLSRAHWYWKSRGAAALILLGKNSLAVYSVSILVSYSVMGLVSRWAAGRPTVLWLTVAGIGMMLLTAKLFDSA